MMQEKIKEMILTKQYDENGYLPSEGQLCQQLSVSRVTIREAVRSMEVRGFVQRIHGKGIKVSSNSVEVMTQSISDMLDIDNVTLDDVLEMRRIIEIQAVALATLRATQAELDKIRKTVEIMENSVCEDATYIDADLNFHLYLVAATKNKALVAITSAYTPLLKRLITVSSNVNGSTERDFHYHRNIYDAILKKDPKSASRFMEIHLLVTEENKKAYESSNNKIAINS